MVDKNCKTNRIVSVKTTANNELLAKNITAFMFSYGYEVNEKKHFNGILQRKPHTLLLIFT